MAKEKTTVAEAQFTKEQLLSATRFANRRDALTAILNDDKTYSIAQVEKELKDFFERKVN